MLLIKSIFLNSQNLGLQKSDDASYKMEGGACKGHEGASVSTLDHSPYCSFFSFFLGQYYIFFFKRQQSYHCNLPIADKYFLNALIRISCCHRANYFFHPSYPKTFCLKTKCFWAKLLIFSLFIGFMAEGGFYGRALTQRPKSITFLQHPHSGPDTSPF